MNAAPLIKYASAGSMLSKEDEVRMKRRRAKDLLRRWRREDENTLEAARYCPGRSERFEFITDEP